jgi:hypothetical protein
MNHFDPRAFLRAGSIGVFGFLPLGEALRLRAQSPAPGRGRADPKDISVIHLVLHGGMSQLDTFDPKPDAQPKFRSIFKPIATNVPGLEICEPLPRTAKLADKYVVILDDPQGRGPWGGADADADRARRAADRSESHGRLGSGEGTGAAQ